MRASSCTCLLFFSVNVFIYSKIFLTTSLQFCRSVRNTQSVRVIRARISCRNRKQTNKKHEVFSHLKRLFRESRARVALLRCTYIFGNKSVKRRRICGKNEKTMGKYILTETYKTDFMLLLLLRL
uniref:(northern house mosquito) hypothetical protein n=1 Tax=Culex pipiens TaxID=7175 RepID=A0A8D8C1E4_CULPI